VAGGLLERDEPLDALLTEASGAASGQGSVVLVTGEAGIGKTSLVSAFLTALNSPARVLAGGCDDLSTPRILGPLRDATQGTRGPLERALADGSHEAVFAAAIEELTGPPPTVLVVEDLHWADDATLDVLGYLGRRVSSLAAMLVFTFRDEEVSTDHAVARMLGLLTGIRVRRLALGPLSPAAVTTLAAGTARDGTALHALTGGNPFYVTEALAAGSKDVPATVGDAVLARYRQLSAKTQAAVEQLSVVPGQVDFGLAEAVLQDQLDFLAEAEQHGILEVRGQGLAFRHELARLAVERSLPAIRRRLCNRTVVEALGTAAVPDLDRLVHHAVEGGAVDAVITYAPRAGQEAARAGSHRQALAHFETALRHADRLKATAPARLIDDYAWELHHAHRFVDAVQAGREAVARYAELGDQIALGEAMVRLALQTFWAGRPDEAIATIERALRVLEPAGSPPTLAYAATYRGVIRAMAELSDESAAALEHARRLATDAGRPDLVSLCLNYLGLSHPTLDTDGRIQHLQDSLQIALAHGLHDCAADAYAHLAELQYWYFRWAELADCLAAGARFTSEHGIWSSADHLETYRCLLLLRRGDWAGAQTGFDANRHRAAHTEVLHLVNEAWGRGSVPGAGHPRRSR